MNYAPKNNVSPHFQSSRVKSGMSVPTQIVVGLIILLAILYTFLPRVLPAIFISLIHPLWKAEADLKLGTASIDELRKTYEDIKANEKNGNALAAENEELKIALGRTIVTKPLLATVLKKPPFSAYDSYILDAGVDLGVAKGNPVYAIGDIPIGTIEDVIGNTSRVKLYSTNGEKFNILIGPSHIEATAEGRGGGYFEASLPRDTKIKIGDQVEIPSLGDSFVGTVDGIASEPSEPFAKILFHQPLNLYEARWILIDTHVTK
jgi:cell shape-determining protein MreC